MTTAAALERIALLLSQKDARIAALGAKLKIAVIALEDASECLECLKCLDCYKMALQALAAIRSEDK